jgi:hypothetical protein
VGGSVGTLMAVCAAYLQAKSIIVVTESGCADQIVDTYLDGRRLVKVVGMEDPKKVVEILKLLE